MGGYADIQKLEPGSIVDLFELDLLEYAGEILYFHGYGHVGPIYWRGQEYKPWPIMADGIGRTTDTQQPSPTLAVGNVGDDGEGNAITGVITALCLAYQDLVGCRITMRSVQAKYLDVRNYPIAPFTMRIRGDSGVTLPASRSLRLAAGSWTLEATVKPGAQTPGWQMIYGGEIGALGFGIKAGQLGFTVVGSDLEIMSNRSLVIGVARHVALTYDHRTRAMVFYIDGEPVATFNVNYSEQALAAAHTRTIAKNSDGSGRLNANLHSLRIYSKPLSHSQVSVSFATRRTYEPIAAYSADQIDGDVLVEDKGRLNGSIDYGASFEPVGYSNPTANPDEGFPDEIWIIDQRVLETPSRVDFKLVSATDFDGRKLPNWPITANVCCWKWKGGYKGPYCQYIPGPMFDINNNPVTDPARDVCPGTLQACEIRFGAQEQPLNFGGYPAADLIRGY